MYEVCSAVVTAPTYCGIYLCGWSRARIWSGGTIRCANSPEILTFCCCCCKTRCFQTASCHPNISQSLSKHWPITYCFLFLFYCRRSRCVPCAQTFQGCRSVPSGAFWLQVPLGWDWFQQLWIKWLPWTFTSPKLWRARCGPGLHVHKHAGEQGQCSGPL